MRLIDADALIAEANKDGAYGYVDAKQIADAPTVDAVEVVRCEDCKLGDKVKIFDLDCIWCRKGHQAKPIRFYCADGERREE